MKPITLKILNRISLFMAIITMIIYSFIAEFRPVYTMNLKNKDKIAIEEIQQEQKEIWEDATLLNLEGAKSIETYFQFNNQIYIVHYDDGSKKEICEDHILVHLYIQRHGYMHGTGYLIISLISIGIFFYTLKYKKINNEPLEKYHKLKK